MKYLFLLVFIIGNYVNAQSVRCLVVTKSIDGQYFALYSDSTWKVVSEGTYIVHNNVTNRTENGTNNKTITTKTSNTQVKKTNQVNSNTTKSQTTSLICGARTKKGGSCQRRVVGGGYCYQHK